MSLVIYIGNTTIIEMQALTNAVTDATVMDATVEVTLTDSAGVELTGQSWPLTLDHVTAGNYRATIEDDIGLLANRTYTATIDATVSGVGAGHWVIQVLPQYRTE